MASGKGYLSLWEVTHMWFCHRTKHTNTHKAYNAQNAPKPLTGNPTLLCAVMDQVHVPYRAPPTKLLHLDTMLNITEVSLHGEYLAFASKRELKARA